MRGQSLQVPRELWPRLMLAAPAQRHRLDGADGAGAAVAAGERGGADRLHHAGLGLAAGLAGARRAADLLRTLALVMAFAGLAAIMGGNGFGPAAAKLPGIVMVLAARSALRSAPCWPSGCRSGCRRSGRGLADRARLLAGRLVGLAIEHHALDAADAARLGAAVLFHRDPVLRRLCRWFAALARLPASVAAIGTMAVPVIGVVASAIALGEPLGPGRSPRWCSRLRAWRWRRGADGSAQCRVARRCRRPAPGGSSARARRLRYGLVSSSTPGSSRP